MGSTNNHYILLFFIAVISTAMSFAQENNPLDEHISIHLSNKNIIEIVEEIKAKSGIDFSYSKDIIEEVFIRSIDADNKTVKDVLDHILNGTGLNYKVIRRHVIIYKPKGYRTKQGEKLKIVTVYDTIITMHHDTIITKKYDTIINRIHHHDTITFFDTINIEKKRPYNWFASVHAGMFRMPSYNIQYDNNNKEIYYSYTGDRSYSTGTDIGIEYKNLSFYTGMNYASRNTKNTYNIKEYDTDTVFDYAYTGGYWDKELVVRYYEWDGQDTTWVNVYDSTYIPVDSSVVSTEIDTSVDKTSKTFDNHYSIIEIPFVIGYRYHTNIKRLSFGIKGGIVAGYIINAKGKLFNKGQFIDINNLMHNRLIFSVISSLSIDYGLNKNIALFTSLYYRKQLIPNYPENIHFYRNPQYFGIRFGARYIFQRE